VVIPAGNAYHIAATRQESIMATKSFDQVISSIKNYKPKGTRGFVDGDDGQGVKPKAKTDDAVRRASLIAHLRAEGKSLADAKAEADEIMDDQKLTTISLSNEEIGLVPTSKKALVASKGADTTEVSQDINQESTMAKSAKAEKAKKSKPAANDLPTYGMQVRRRANSSRWVVVDALMALEKPTTAAKVADRIASKLPHGEERALAHVATTAAWMEKNGVKGFVGLEKARAAAEPKAKKVKAKVKTKKAKKDDDLLG
jgi:hypothetical protein